MNAPYLQYEGTTYPMLYKRDSRGKVQVWSISVLEAPEGPTIVTVHGKKGGKLQENAEVITKGKNVGKANETTTYQQAELEAKSRWNKQVERKGYVDSEDKLDVDQRPGAEPMLAHRFDKFPEKITYPCAVQPKLDGHRCIAVFENGQTKLFSRQRKPITGLPHIERELTDALLKMGRTEKLILDGELYNHEYKHDFETLTSYIRNEEPKEGHEIVQYHLYDIVTPKVPFRKRTLALGAIVEYCVSDAIQFVFTQFCNSDEVLTYFRRFESEGYEGAMLRNLESEYVGKRSYDLQKVKEFADSEFKVIDIEEGRGKMKGHAICVCNVAGGTFRTKMEGSMEKLQELFQNKDQYIGRQLTVRYQGLTKDGIPRFPIGVRFRKDI